MPNRSLLLATLALALVGAAPAAFPQATPPPAAEAKKEEPKKDPKTIDYERAVKDLPRFPGRFTLYQRKKEILLELPEADLGQIVLFQATLQSGVDSQNLAPGAPVTNAITEAEAFRLDRRDEQLLLVRPNLKFRWKADDPLALAAQRSFPEAIVQSFRIEQTNPDQKLLLVNVTNLFYGDAVRLTEAVQSALGGGYALDRERSFTERIRSFAENAAVQMALHFQSQRGGDDNPLAILLGLSSPSQLEDDRSAPLRVTYNLSFRTDSDYVPRLADPRVGYFVTDFFDVGRMSEADRKTRFINRWDLRKKDPTAAVSDPVNPVVWTLDSSIPPRFREAVKRGLLRWNSAFEGIGIRNAFVVRDAPADADYDHADARFNVVRWVLSESEAYAVTHVRTDPYTGRILNASITVDANIVSMGEQEWLRYLFPRFQTANPLAAAGHEGCSGCTDELLDELGRKWEPKGWKLVRCRHAQGAQAQMQFGWAALQATGFPMGQKQYLDDFVADLVAHEAGHAVGLRHNFVASSNLTTAQLADPTVFAREGFAASVMDYNPLNFVALRQGRGGLLSQTLGRYDRWAIEYGYAPTGAKDPIAERPALARIAARSAQPGLAYQPDESADGADPLVVRFDGAKDSLNFSQAVVDTASGVRRFAIERLPRPGESYGRRTSLILGSFLQTSQEALKAVRFVGGVRTSRSFRSDPGAPAPVQPVEPKLQREALRFVVRNVLKPGAYDLSPQVLTSLAREGTMSLDTASLTQGLWTAPARRQLGQFQTVVLANLMATDRLDQIAENELKFGARPDRYTMAEHYAAMAGAVFGEVGNGKPLSPLRRDLQQQAVTLLLAQAGSAPNALNGDARIQATDTLRRMRARFAAAELGTGLDATTRLHYRTLRDQIDRFQNRLIQAPR